MVILKRSITELDDVVVIGYGTTTRRLSTATVSKVSAEEISRQPVPNPIAALQGLVPGLFIAQTNGLPGANFNVQLRGLNSLKQGTEPLFVVDGVPFMLNSFSLGQIMLQNNNIFNNFNPADIESIEVLKDADATAIYGSQGANGVVLITTKKGKKGKTTVDINYYTGFGKVTRTLPLLNTQQYIAMRREAFANDGVTPTVSTAPDLLSWDTTAYTDWRKMLIGGTARTQNLLASLSGGTATTNFLFSTGYYSEETVFPGDEPYRRGTARLSLNHNSLDQRFKAAITTYFSWDKKNLPLNDLTAYVYLPPNTPDSYDANGNLNWTAGVENPMSFLHRQYRGENNNLGANATFLYAFTNKLVLKTSIGYTGFWLDEESAIPIKAQRPAANVTGTAQWTSAIAKSWIAEPYLEYKQHWPLSRLTLLAGVSWQNRSGSSNSLTGTQYTNDDLLGLSAAAGDLSVNNHRSQYRYNAVFGRINYALKERYIININMRRDGSSRFGSQNRFANFASAGAAYILSQENFFKKALHFISFAKLRMSFGVTGNDQIGDYQYLDSWSTATAYSYNGAPAGVLPNRLYNNAYQWERVKKTELGLDLGFLKDRVVLSVAAFRNRSSNQLVQYNLPATTGFSSILKNLDASVQNTGVELELNAGIIETAAFNWHASFNISFLRNKLLAYPGLELSSDKYNFSIGEPLRVLFAYRYNGIDPATGVYAFEDIDGNGSISSPADITIVGTPMQQYFTGFTNKLSYRSLEFSFLLQFVKQTGRNYLGTLNAIPGTMANQPHFVLDRWEKAGQEALVQKFTTTASSAAYRAYAQFRSSSAALDDASYMRLRNIYLGWSFPSHISNKMKASSARLYLQAQNLFTLTDYKGTDPETQSLISLPPLKMITAGIQITF